LLTGWYAGEGGQGKSREPKKKKKQGVPRDSTTGATANGQKKVEDIKDVK